MDLFSKIEFASTLGVICYASYRATDAIVKPIVRKIYPISQSDGLEAYSELPAYDFYAPNCGVRILLSEYEALSIIRKIANAVGLFFMGAAIGGVVGIGLSWTVTIAFAIPRFITIATLFSMATGSIVGIGFDPGIGLPALYHYFSW